MEFAEIERQIFETILKEELSFHERTKEVSIPVEENIKENGLKFTIRDLRDYFKKVAGSYPSVEVESQLISFLEKKGKFLKPRRKDITLWEVNKRKALEFLKNLK